MMDWLAPLPWSGPELAGLGGVCKAAPEDFEVEELPAYEPAGEGDHLFLWIEKAGVPADALLAHVARALGIDRRDIGCAGMKDAQAVTRQWISVPAAAADRLDAVSAWPRAGRVDVLRTVRHRNKLKTGHLRGNKFRCVLRGCDAGAAARAPAWVAHLTRKGVPNYYGTQRFGRAGQTLHTGLALLRGKRLDRAPTPNLRRLALSSAQSGLFNRYLARRIDDGLLHTVIAGEVCQVRASGGPFVCDDPAREQARFEAGEVVPAGPIFGPKMRAAMGPAAERELALLAAADLTAEDFARSGKLTLGTRRPNLLFPENLAVAVNGNDATVTMTLPSGAYATVLLECLQGERPAARSP